MTEPTIICPNCKTEIKLTESLAAPLIESIRRDYEKRLALKDNDIVKKEEALREREEAVSKAKQTIDNQVAEKLLLERAKIATEESKKAKLALQTEINQKTQELAELQEIINQREVKLAEAQKAQGDRTLLSGRRPQHTQEAPQGAFSYLFPRPLSRDSWLTHGQGRVS